jgi:hypothetical protein
MSDSNNVTMGLHRLPILTHDNSADWEIAVISFLTNASDHSRVIEQRPDGKGTLVDPVRPTHPTEATKWDASECEAFGITMSTALKLHREIILKHRADREPVHKLWVKLCNSHQSRDASLRHHAWLEFFTTRKASDESYSAYVARKVGLCARIDRLTPATQSTADRSAKLTLLAVLFGLPYDDNVLQTLTTQPNLILQQASDAMFRVDTGLKLHHADAEPANAASDSNCWKCDAPGHLTTNCPHAGTINDFVIKCNAAYRERTRGRRSKNQAPSSSSSNTAAANATASAPDTSPAESAGRRDTCCNIWRELPFTLHYVVPVDNWVRAVSQT